MEIKITSSAFKEGEMIPAKYTCDGEDISPPLQWDSVPVATRCAVSAYARGVAAAQAKKMRDEAKRNAARSKHRPGS